MVMVDTGENRMLKNLKPFMFENSRVPGILSKIAPIDIWAISFGVWVWCKGSISPVTRRHERIHFQQQLECLFLGQWILYGFWWLVGYIKYRREGVKDPGRQAYYYIPFEKEAYEFETQEDYLAKRKRYAWIKFI